jgi:hypothetical protein
MAEGEGFHIWFGSLFERMAEGVHPMIYIGPLDCRRRLVLKADSNFKWR